MATTPLMNLDLPVVSTTLGPEWATKVNAAFETVDSHDHSSGKGTKVTAAGLNINADLDIQSNKLFNLTASQYVSAGSPLSGATNANSVNVSSGNLYFTNGSGVSIQITSGGSIVSSPGSVESLQFDTVNTNLVIGPSDNFVYLAVDTTAGRSITLPLANSVATGRIYYVKDTDGMANTNNITINTSGSDTIDGASSATIDSDFAGALVIGDGVSAWFIS